jgi:hypothetical protein
MKTSGTRRQLFRALIAGVAVVPVITFAKKSAAHPDHPGHPGHPGGHTHCLLKGTKIATPLGDRPVQDLQIGEEVCTVAGPKKIKWIGYNKFTKETGKIWHESVMPIRVARLAIDDRSPHSDLYVSPLHCIFFDNVLIPAKYLINGSSVKPEAPSDMSSAIEYYHIDLDTHEVIYAEGAPVESFFAGESDREGFSNFVQYERLYGPERQPRMTPFAPILAYRNRHERMRGLARSLVSNVVDVRDPIQIAHDQIASRADALFV